MLGTIIGAVTGLAGPIINISSKILELQTAKVNSKTDVDKAEIDAELQIAHDRKALLLAEAGDRLTSIINVVTRTVMAIPAIFIIWKLWIWDKVIGSLSGCAGAAGQAEVCQTFRTDPISANEWYVIIAIYAFYFLSVAIQKRK